MVKLIKDKKIKDYDPEIINWAREDKGVLESQIMRSFPQPGDNIKDKKYFAVKDYEKVLYYKKGELVDVLKGGVYQLDKEDRIKGTEIVWVDTSLLDIPWGIPLKDGIPTKDNFKVGLYGDLRLRISDVKTFYNNIVAGKKIWTVQNLKDWIISLLNTSIRDIFKKYDVRAIILEEREHVINLIQSKVTDEFLRYGLEFETFNVLGEKTNDDVAKLLNFSQDKKIAVEKSCQADLDKCLEEKKDIQDRLKQYSDKLEELENDLLNDNISREDFDMKKELLQQFIDEKNEDLKRVEEKIKNIPSKL